MSNEKSQNHDAVEELQNEYIREMLSMGVSREDASAMLHEAPSFVQWHSYMLVQDTGAVLESINQANDDVIEATNKMIEAVGSVEKKTEEIEKYARNTSYATYASVGLGVLAVGIGAYALYSAGQEASSDTDHDVDTETYGNRSHAMH